MNTAGGPGAVDIAFFPVGQDNGGAPVRWNVPLAVGESLFEGDILAELFGYSPPAVGSLAVSSAAAQPLLWMRTYTEEPIAGGGRRDLRPGDPAAHRRRHGQRPALTDGSRGFSHDATTRANLILQNTRAAADGSRLASEVRVELLAADGSRAPRADLRAAAGRVPAAQPLRRRLRRRTGPGARACG